MKRSYLVLAAALLMVSCAPKQGQTTQMTENPLPSWNQTSNKEAIVNFVTQAVTEGAEGFIPQADRIAVFDNDGTLWCEQPLYIEMIYSVAATAQLAKEQPALQKKPELKALAAGDKATFAQAGEKGIMEAFAISHTVVKPAEFDRMTQEWLDTAKHARFGHPYLHLTYKPMLELLEYLRANGFKTYIVSGGSSIFMRNFSQEAYGIPAEQVIGTMFKAAYLEGTREVVLKPEVWHMDDNVGKPEAIFNLIGRKPVLAFGNSDGDLQMLQWTSTNTLPNLCLYLHHTDAEREYAYDSLTTIGTLKKGLIESQQRGWVVVDMKRDFNRIFSYEE